MTSENRQDALLDELLRGCSEPKDILGEHGLLKQLQKRLFERALQGEMTTHLGYEPHAPEGHGSGNSRNGKGRKTVQTEAGQFEIEVPRDREGSFEPQLVKKRQRRLSGFDDKVLAFYARGLSTREIQAELESIYGAEVSPTLISNVTDAVVEELQAWQSRPLSAVYPILYFDALFVKSREEGPVVNKAVYLALGINLEGEKELLGLWIAQAEGAKFWLSVFTELKNRGLEDCFVACIDGLKGLPEAIRAGLSQGPGAALHRAQGAQLAQVRAVEGAQECRRRFAGDLRGGNTPRGRACPGTLRREVGRQVPGHQP